MGYDMYAVEASRQWHGDLDEAMNIADEAAQKEAVQKVYESFGEVMNAEDGYWRENVWGMSYLRDQLDRLGLLWDGPSPEWPDVSGWDWDNLTDEQEQQQRAHLAFRGDCPEGKVPVWKYCSNDGWVVTPQECLWIADTINAFLSLGSKGEVGQLVAASVIDARERWAKWDREMGRQVTTDTTLGEGELEASIENLRGFGHFNAMAAKQGGYTVC